jgi:hypothetical protein
VFQERQVPLEQVYRAPMVLQVHLEQTEVVAPLGHLEPEVVQVHLVQTVPQVHLEQMEVVERLVPMARRVHLDEMASWVFRV